MQVSVLRLMLDDTWMAHALVLSRIFSGRACMLTTFGRWEAFFLELCVGIDKTY